MRQPNQNPGRRVNHPRTGGGRGEIAGNTGNIVLMTKANERLYFVTERGVASAQMADQIDPDGLNPALPMFIQRLDFEYGANAIFIQRTLCTADALLDQTYLPEGFDRDAAFLIAYAAAEDLAGVADTIAALKAEEATTRARLEAGAISVGIVPRTQNLKGRVEQAVSHLRSVQIGAMTLAEMFHPKARANLPWASTLKEAINRTFPAGDESIPFLEDQIDVLERVANYRNAAVHPDHEKAFVTTDYDLRPDGVLIAPTVEVLHPRAPHQRQDTVQFLEQLVDQVSYSFENLLALLANNSARGGRRMLISFVAQSPELHRGSHFRWQSDWREGMAPVLPVGA